MIPSMIPTLLRRRSQRGQIDWKMAIYVVSLISTILGWAVAFGRKQADVTSLEGQVIELKGQFSALHESTEASKLESAVRLERIETLLNDLKSEFDDVKEKHGGHR